VLFVLFGLCEPRFVSEGSVHGNVTLTLTLTLGCLQYQHDAYYTASIHISRHVHLTDVLCASVFHLEVLEGDADLFVGESNEPVDAGGAVGVV